MTAHISEDGLNREESVAEHTEKTTFLCREKGKRCGLANVMSLCGIFHDMGKNKRRFDEYIHADESVRRRLKGTIAHASTGAKYFYDRYSGNSQQIEFMVEMISYAVAAHHGLFDCVNIEQTDVFSQRIEEIDDYEEACRNAARDYLNAYETDEAFEAAAAEFALVWNQIKEPYARIKSLMTSKYGRNAGPMLAECKLFLLACLQRLLLSILIDSDWEATSDFMGNVDTLSKQPVFDTRAVFQKAGESFEEYMRGIGQSSCPSRMTEKERAIADARNALQEECRAFAAHPAGIYCLPIPTGGGKTLSSLAYALEYCRRHPEVERVFYVSPYISITEQNAQVFREAIGNDEWILEHHSSVIREEEAQDEDYRARKASRYDINWEEPFICTTFVQLMNTLFSDKSEAIRRMHRLVNAVVIIDEVQSMPLKCVNTFNYMINFLNAVCNTDIILCTATQPALEAAECPICYSSPKDMIRNTADWFERFDRVRLHTPAVDEKYTFESLGEQIAAQTETYQSILVVLNTKSAVRKLYDILKAYGISAQYLTTNLCAEHRSDRIKAIKEALKRKQEPVVVISTNLIEAGVDISFECVYRAMAGLDSLAQTAGRCNRSGELEYGDIYLIVLEGENTGNMEELQQNIRAAETVIAQYKSSGQTDSLLKPAWMDAYYREVYCGAADKMNFPIKELDTNMIALLSEGFVPAEKRRLLNQAYKTAGQAYRVIDNDSVGVIVPYKKGSEIIAALQTASGAAALGAYIRQAQRYTVNVRSSQLRQYAGLIMPISDKLPGLYMAAAPGVYNCEVGIAPEWETLII